MRTLIIWTALFSSLLVAIAAPAQAQQRKYMDAGFVQHQSGSVTVKADFPRPLLQAVTAVRKNMAGSSTMKIPPISVASNFLMQLTRTSEKAIRPRKDLLALPAGASKAFFRNQQT